MKNISLIITTCFLLITSLTQAQKVEFEGKKYDIKGKNIILNGKDVTATLSTEQLNNIKNKMTREQHLRKINKEKQKAENKQKKAEKGRK